MLQSGHIVLEDMAPQPTTSAFAAAFRKVEWRVLPILFVCYFFNYLDRTNVGIAQLQMKDDLGFTAATYGLGAGLVYIGFLFFEVPSTVWLHKTGARRTLMRIMLLWGLITCLTSLIRIPEHFYIARIALGAAEAGFVPGVLLYLSYWFPVQRRARITAIFLIAIPVSGVLGSPASGWILNQFSGVGGVAGWQWLFILEGLPTMLLGVTAYFALTDRPADATWLTAQERAIVIDTLAGENERKASRSHASFLTVLRDPKVWFITYVLFASFLVANTLTFWSPTIIHNSGIRDTAMVGLLAALPPLCGIVAMILVGRSSDRRMERRWHTAIPMLCAATGLALLPIFKDVPGLSVLLLAMVAAGHYSSLPTMYSLPSTYMSGGGAPSGIATMHSVGSMGGLIAPSLLGFINGTTGSFSLGFQIYAGIVVLAAVTLLLLVPGHLLGEDERPEG